MLFAKFNTALFVDYTQIANLLTLLTDADYLPVVLPIWKL